MIAHLVVTNLPRALNLHIYGSGLSFLGLTDSLLWRKDIAKNTLTMQQLKNGRGRRTLTCFARVEIFWALSHVTSTGKLSLLTLRPHAPGW